MNTAFDGDCVNNVAFGVADDCVVADFAAVEYRWIFWMSVATAAAFVALAVPRVLYLSRSRTPSVARGPGILWIAKLIAGSVFVGLRLGLLIVAIRQQTSHPTQRLLASSALNFTASCLLLALSPLEHFKRPRPSILACSFLFLTLIYDVTRCPSLWSAYRDRRSDESYAAFTALFTAALVTESIFLVLESVQRTKWVAWEAADHSPEETSSILSLALYSWLNPLLWWGYHEPLAMKDLYALDCGISVDMLNARNKSDPEEGSKATSTRNLLLWLARPLGSSALLPIFPRLCLLGFTFCQPFFLQRLLRFLSSHDNEASTASGLVAVAILTYSGIAVSTALYWYYQERFQSLLRGYLISAIYRKTAHIQHVGDGDSAAVTLMGADVERIYTGLRLIHEVWANIIQISLAAWLLQRQLGLAFLAPLIIVLLGFAGSFALSRRATCECSRVLIAVSASLSQLPQAVAPALAFAFGPHVLDQTRAYTALSFLALLTAPLLVVLQSLPIIAASMACLQRIKVFLIQDGRVDGRLFQLPAGNMVKSEGLAGEKDIKSFVHVEDGSFGWTAGKPILKGINLSLSKSSTTFVVGPIAAGKSTLCRALLGEVHHAKGSVVMGSTKLAYCDQTPFLFNASIMENIIGFSYFDKARYSEVIEATLLRDDLTNLPEGDRTVVGTKGVSLSGGQRQRVSLARALYHDAEIIVLDDVFRGLDSSTQHLVCHSIFKPDGLLRRRGTTTIVCTHSTQLLPAADYIVALSQDGTIADQGSLAEIAQDEQRARRVGITHFSKPSFKTNRHDARQNDLEIQPEKAETTATTDRPRVDVPSSKIQATSAPLPTVDIAVYRHWLSTINPLPLVVYAILVIGVGLCSNFPTIWLKLWSADSVSPAPQHPFAFWMGIYALLGGGGIICVFPVGLIMLRTAVRLAGTDLHHATVDMVMHSSLRFLSSTDVGKVLNLFSQDINIMDTQLPRMVNNLCFCLATAVGQAVVIAVASAWLAISYPFFMLLLWAVQRIYLPSSKRLRLLDLEAKTPLYTNFLDTLAGLPTIRAFGWLPHQLARNNALLDDSQRPSYLLAMAQQWLTLTMNILVALVAVLLVVLATRLNSDAGNVGVGLVTLITLGTTLTTIVVAYTGLETSLGAISRLKSFREDTEPESRGSEDVMPDDTWPQGGRVQMIGVDASYNGTEKVLKELDLVVEADEKIAICGRTGSGKSSILALLLRLIHPLPNSSTTADAKHTPILIDDLPLNTIDHTVFRERIISASQDQVFLPDGTSFRTNLDPWGTASDEECTLVLHDLGLITAVEAKGGLEAPISGAELSAGQRQLFSTARAVLRRRVRLRQTGINGGLLLLDEITSGADAETERRVRRVLDDEFSDYTVIMVTHRREMAVSCDRVVVLDSGKVVEDGAPQKLLERRGGWFKSLWGSEKF